MQDGFEHRDNLPVDAGDEAKHPGVTNKFGIEDTIDVVDSLVKLANAVKVSMADGNFSAMDAFNFTSAVISLPKALTGLDMIPAEINDLDDDEIQVIVNVIRDTLEYASDETIQEIINKALAIGLGIKGLVGAIKNA